MVRFEKIQIRCEMTHIGRFPFFLISFIEHFNVISIEIDSYAIVNRSVHWTAKIPVYALTIHENTAVWQIFHINGWKYRILSDLDK